MKTNRTGLDECAAFLTSPDGTTLTNSKKHGNIAPTEKDKHDDESLMRGALIG